MYNNDFRGFYSLLFWFKKVGCVQPMLKLSCFSDYVFERLSYIAPELLHRHMACLRSKFGSCRTHFLSVGVAGILLCLPGILKHRPICKYVCLFLSETIGNLFFPLRQRKLRRSGCQSSVSWQKG